MKQPKQPAFEVYRKSIAQAQKAWKSGSSGSLTLVHGKSDFLGKKAVGAFRKTFDQSDSDIPLSTHDGRDMAEGDVLGLFQSRSLFESCSAHIVRDAGGSKVLTKYLSTIKKLTLKNHVLLWVGPGKQATKLQNAAKTLGAETIRCEPPATREMRQVIQAIGRSKGVAFSNTGLGFFESWVGQNLYVVENEIIKLSLLFPDRKDPLSPEDIAEHLHVVREDHTFKLTNLLLDRKYAEAKALAVHLIEQRESAIAILGILSKHVRTCLTIVSGGMPENPRLPSFVLRSYNQYVRGLDKNRLTQLRRALEVCHSADMRLKSSQIKRDDLAITEVMQALSL